MKGMITLKYCWNNWENQQKGGLLYGIPLGERGNRQNI